MKVVDADYYVVSHATAPFTKPESIDRCIDSVTKGDQYDSAFTVERIQTFMWKNGAPMNFDVDHFPRTQDLDPIYMETSGAFVFPREVFQQYNRRVGVKPCLVEVEPVESIDIDTEYDMMVAQAIYSHLKEKE
jgi:CMP-N-acetylneuraminic acid synthetase